MTLFVWNILLAMVWASLTGSFTLLNLGAGFALGYVILWFSQHTISPSPYFTKVRLGIGFVLFFLQELVLANLRVAHHVLSPIKKISPSLVAVPLDVESSAEITLLANLITLTPGSLSLDVSDDRKVLYVHAMNCSDPEALRQDIKNGFERRVLEMLR